MPKLQLKANKLLSLFLKGAFFCLLSVFLLVNMFASQFISPLYFQLVKEDKKAVVNFLNKIKNLPVFSSFLETNKNIYGGSLQQEVFAESLKRKQKIAGLEILLQRNPKSRDLLYNLHLLYNEEGDKIKAEEYLRKAKEIDPSI
jgi:tetratricopeptide (TPR) repeat protein